MRLFIAINLPDEIRTQLKELQRVLRPLASTAKWVAPESIHITLKFLGDIDEQLLPEIGDVLTAATAGKSVCDIQLVGVGAFPNVKRPATPQA